jgi:hypothetical protein
MSYILGYDSHSSAGMPTEGDVLLALIHPSIISNYLLDLLLLQCCFHVRPLDRVFFSCGVIALFIAGLLSVLSCLKLLQILKYLRS